MYSHEIKNAAGSICSAASKVKPTLRISVLRNRIQFHYTPKHTSWLNMARQTLEKDMRGPKKNWHIKLLQSLEEDLMYLQREYKIIKKDKKIW